LTRRGHARGVRGLICGSFGPGDPPPRGCSSRFGRLRRDGPVLVGVMLGTLSLAACDTTSVAPQYTPSTSNVLAIQSALGAASSKVRLGDFTTDAGAERVGCRAIDVDVAGGKSLGAYLKDALRTELVGAGAYDAGSSTVISGRLTTIKVSTFTKGAWTLGIDIKSNSSAGYHVEITRPFPAAYMSADVACVNAGNAFAPTVQALFAEMIANPGFAQLAARRRVTP